jgi:hypothetical protein
VSTTSGQSTASTEVGAVNDDSTSADSVRVIVVDVVATLYGEKSNRSLYVLDQGPESLLGDLGSAAIGMPMCLFVERDRAPWAHSEILTQLRNSHTQHIASSSFQNVLAGDLGLCPIVVDTGGRYVLLPLVEVIPDKLSECDESGKAMSPPSTRRVRVPYVEFCEWLSVRAAQITPSLTIELLGGSLGQSARIEIMSSSSAQVESWGLELPVGFGAVPSIEALFSNVSRVRFQDLPVAVGHSEYPDSPAVSIRLRTELWSQRVVVRHRPPSNGAEFGEWERAIAVLHSVSGVTAWLGLPSNR